MINRDLETTSNSDLAADDDEEMNVKPQLSSTLDRNKKSSNHADTSLLIKNGSMQPIEPDTIQAKRKPKDCRVIETTQYCEAKQKEIPSKNFTSSLRDAFSVPSLTSMFSQLVIKKTNSKRSQIGGMDC